MRAQALAAPRGELRAERLRAAPPSLLERAKQLGARLVGASPVRFSLEGTAMPQPAAAAEAAAELGPRSPSSAVVRQAQAVRLLAPRPSSCDHVPMGHSVHAEKDVAPGIGDSEPAGQLVQAVSADVAPLAVP